MTQQLPLSWLVTGANQGLGLGLARQHVQRGGHVVATYRNAPSDALSNLAAANPQDLTLLEFDQQRVPDGDAILAALSRPIEVMIHNAGIFGPRNTSLQGLDYDAILETININALGVLRVTNAFLPALAQTPTPRIAALSSLLGTPAKGGGSNLAYRLSKAALNMAMHAIAAELASSGIATACLRPGPVKTQMNPNGTLSPDDSAHALLNVIDAMSFRPTPQFLDFTGEELAW